MATAFGETLPVDGGSEDTWGLLLLAAWIASYAAYQVRDENADWADYELSKPKLKDYSEKLYAHGSVSGAVTVDLANGNHQSMTLTGNVTLTISNAPPSGEFGALFMYITQDGTGGRTVTFPAAFEDTSGSNFTISGTAASTMTEVIAYTLDGGTLWRTKQGDAWV